MPGSYRASIGHNPLIRVKKQSVALAGKDITLTPASGGGTSRGGGTTFGLGLDTTNVNVWGTTNDVVTGWEWAYPPSYPNTTERYAKLSGMFQFAGDTDAWPGSTISGSQNQWPASFPGRAIFKINADWRDLEPNEGSYSGLGGQFNKLSTLNAGWGGVQIDVRGAVFAGPQNITAPGWLQGRGIAVAGTGYYNIGDIGWYTPFRLLITQVANYSPPSWQGTVYKIPAHPRLVTQIVHGSGSSAGEEADLGTPPANHVETCRQWGVAYGADARKLGWTGEGSPQSETNQIMAAGLGTRGGIIENWLRPEYTPAQPTTEIGQDIEQFKTAAGANVTDSVYLIVDDTFLPIAGNRHFADQAEAYQTSHMTGGGNAKPWGIKNKLQLTYRMVTMRYLQMQRVVMAIEVPENFKNLTGANETNGREGFINPEIIKWASLQLGKRVDGIGGADARASEAFCMLCRTYSYGYNSLLASPAMRLLTLNNFERWLTQREAWGGTTATQNVAYGWNPGVQNQVDVAHQVLDQARQMTDANVGIGLRLDDRFLTRNVATSVAVKVTYLDNNTQAWTLNYRNSSGNAVSVTPTTANSNSGNVRTATFFLPTFSARTAAVSDLELKGSTATPFMFVRVIKV